ncbi:gamma-butyrobetaine hydroxylase-like domain-containing protein [Rhodovibrio salinarum]|uniref:DUF971 domain-containing protein n=1 Tax=Rhodovibrio salinarum TaxID=1087 RepID=A0A934QHT9_9PROT|nr:DUF971 domain-containing protein [Rhodovibrio salinarum]MBK1696947.1 DUF971 domain-containing protein [Rhodovibrio salinarum]
MAKDIQSDEAQPYGTQHWPLEIRYVQARKELEIDFDDGQTFVYPAELLRVESPSAEVQGHSPAEKQTVSGRKYVGIMTIEPVGNYAIKIHFDDLHDTGIFSWAYLRQLGENKQEIWQRYLDALDQRGLSREPRRRGTS